MEIKKDQKKNSSESLKEESTLQGETKEQKISRLEKEIRELKDRNEEIKGPFIVTSDLKISEKLQKNGFRVIHITGGLLDDGKKHYFKTTLEKIKELRSKKKELLFDKDELELFSVVEKVIPSKEMDTGLKEMVHLKGPRGKEGINEE